MEGRTISKVIFKLKFESPKKSATKNNNMYHLIYIGTRDGVALNEDMKEFENTYNKSTNEEYVEYISDRPRSHGLFGREGEIIDLKELSSYMKNYEGYVYRGIVSLREDEALEKGFDEKENWEMLMRSKMRYISKQLGVPYSKLGWVGAFHRESGHPHVHIMMWDKSNNRNKDLNKEYRKGTIPKKNIEAIRKELTKEIFNNEIEKVLSIKNIYRDFLTSNTKNIDDPDNKSLFELNEKVDEINIKFDVVKYQEQIRVLKKEISESNNIDEIESKKTDINELKIKIDEANKKINMYAIKDTIKGLENEKEIIQLQRELESARALGNIEKYEEYIYQLKFNTGIFKLQKDRKICMNRKEVIKLKCELVGLINKKKMMDIKNKFKDENIDINSAENEKLTKEQIELKEIYEKLKVETKKIEVKSMDDLEEKIFDLSSEYEVNKWKLDTEIEGIDTEIEEKLFSIENGNEYIDEEYLLNINNELDDKIKLITETITDLKNRPLYEAKVLDEDRVKDTEATNLFELEKEMKEIKKQYNIGEIEGKLKKLNSSIKSDIKNEKILELENKVKNLENDMKNGSYTNIDYIKNEIVQLKNEINNEKEIQILKELDEFDLKLNSVKGELGSVDVEYNDFKLEEKIRREVLNEIEGEIRELRVPKGGRLQYKLMPTEVKMEIDKITDKIVNLPQYRKAFEGYLKSVEDLTRLYTDKPDDVKKAIDNAREDMYKRIGNNILKSKKEMVIDNKSPQFVTQKLLINIFKDLTRKTNQNKNKTNIVMDRSKAQKIEYAKKHKAEGLYQGED